MKCFSLVKLLALVVVTSVYTGCGSSDSTKVAELRVVNSVNTSQEYDISVDGIVLASNMSFAEHTGYADFDEGVRQYWVSDARGGDVQLQTSLQLVDKYDYTTILVRRDGNRKSPVDVLFLTDDNTPPDPKQFKLRIVNAAYKAGNLDAYLVREGEGIDDREPDVLYLEEEKASDYLEKDSKEYRIVIAYSGSRNIALDLGGVNFGNGQVRTLVILAGKSSVEPLQAILLNDRNF